MPGHEWAVFRLGLRGSVSKIIVDTNHFKGNYPDSVVVESTMIRDQYPDDKTTLLSDDHHHWRPLLPAAKLKPHSLHHYDGLVNSETISHVRVKMFPDGGISRIRIIGTPKM